MDLVGRRSFLILPVMLILLASTFLTGCKSVPYTDINAAVLASENVERRLEKINGKYKLGATDVVAINVRNQGDISGSHTIRPDGNVTVDLIGDIYIEGMTPMQAADVIAKSLQVYVRDVDVLIRVTGFNSKKYFVFGETSGVGEQVFDGDITVLRAIGRARGVTTRAAWDRVRLVRATPTTRQVFKINLAHIIKEGQWDTNVQLQANDVLYIPPTNLARVGYAIDSVLFPIRSILGAIGTFNSVGGNN